MNIELVDPSSLSLHPLLKLMPDPDSELMTSMAIDIQERGIDDALIVDEKNRVMSGRIRLKVALQSELAEVPIRRAPGTDAASIIVNSLLQRRHHSKSALAYLAFPFFETMLAEARDRRVRILRAGGKVEHSTQNVLCSPNAEQVARQAGVSRALFFQAAEVHKLFKKHPDAKEKFEPLILSGELSLGYTINGIAGLISTKGKSRGADDQLELFSRGIHTLRVRWSKWDLIPQKNRTFIANEFAQAIADAPDEIQDRILATLKQRKAAAR